MSFNSFLSQIENKNVCVTTDFGNKLGKCTLRTKFTNIIEDKYNKEMLYVMAFNPSSKSFLIDNSFNITVHEGLNASVSNPRDNAYIIKWENNSTVKKALVSIIN